MGGGWLATARDPLELYKLIPDAHRDSVDVLELSKDGLAFWSGWGARIPLIVKGGEIVKDELG